MATNEKLAEPILKGLITIVQANMPSALAKVAASYPEDIVPLPVPAPANYYLGERLVIPEFPALVFDADTTGIDPEEFANLFAVYDWTIAVDILLQSDDEGVLAKQIWRYSRALWAILYGNQDETVNNGAVAISVRPRNGMKSPLTSSGGAYFKGWRWLLEVHRLDDLT